MTKAEIRTQIAGLRPDFQTLEKMSAAVIKKFQTLELFQQAKSVGAYMPLADEVDVAPLLPLPSVIAAHSRGLSRYARVQCLEKTFYVPAFDAASGAYRLARMTTELKKGRFGIFEPAVPVFAREDELDLIIVPGVAFDRSGNRIGRGGGFYDRLLPLYSAVRAGICFDFQYMETVPAEEHDAQMDLLITESKILKFAMNH